MALYSYEALDGRGQKLRGNIDASSPAAAKQQLQAQGLYPITITSNGTAASTTLWGRLTARSVNRKDLILFTKQLSTLLRSGIPLVQSLELLIGQMTGTMKNIVVGLKDAVQQGQSLAAAMSQRADTFPNLYIQLIRAGEATGKLETILERLTEYLTREQEIEDRITAATRQPKIQLGFILLVTGFLIVKVIPQITSVFARSKVVLPWPTRMLLGISSTVRDYYWILIPVIAAIYAVWFYWSRTERGQLIIDKITLRLPLIGYFARMTAVVQFCSTLGMLLGSGVNLTQALDIVVDIVDNKVLATKLSTARDKIIKEGRISAYLNQTGLFPPVAIYLINTGEQSGKLDTMLNTVAENYEKELNEYVDQLTSILNPVILVLMASIVGFIVIAIVLPMTQMSQAFTR